MRTELLINENWLFRYHDGSETTVNIPHTWNNIDGQDGGDDLIEDAGCSKVSRAVFDGLGTVLALVSGDRE